MTPGNTESPLPRGPHARLSPAGSRVGREISFNELTGGLALSLNGWPGNQGTVPRQQCVGWGRNAARTVSAMTGRKDGPIQRRCCVESRHAANWPRVYCATLGDENREWSPARGQRYPATGALNRDEVGAQTGAAPHVIRPTAIKSQAGVAPGHRHHQRAGTWQKLRTNGTEGVVYPKLRRLMDRCGNDAPVLWMLHDRGYDLNSLRRRESETERENRLLREEVAALRRVIGRPV